MDKKAVIQHNNGPWMQCYLVAISGSFGTTHALRDMKDSENIHEKLTKDMNDIANTVTWNSGMDLIALKKGRKKYKIFQ